MADAKRAVGLVVGLLVLGLLVAFLLPVALGPIAGPSSTSSTLDVGNTTDLKHNLNVTLDSVDDTADTATYTVNADGNTASTTVDNGTENTVTVDGIDVTINVSDVTASDATATYEYPTDYGWGAGASAMWGILPVMIVLAAFLYVVYLGTRRL